MTDFHHLLTRALGNPPGIAVNCSSPERLRMKLYTERKKHAPIYEGLAFVVSPKDPLNTLWIIHNGKE